MINKKLSDIFAKEKQKDKSKPDFSSFNESYFQCKLAYHPHKLSLIKVNAFIAVGKDAGMPMMIKCRWFIKRNNKCSEIQGITSGCYQPCIDDLGCSIYVQIEPIIEGKTYTGALITKETGPLESGSTFETEFNELKNSVFHSKESKAFSVRLESVKGIMGEVKQQQLPQQILISLHKQQNYNFDIEIVGQTFKNCFWVTKKYPKIEFIRKSYNSLIIEFNETQSMRLAFAQNIDRQLFGMLIKTLTASSTLEQSNINTIQKQIIDEKGIKIQTNQPVANQQVNNEESQENESLKRQKIEKNEDIEEKDLAGVTSQTINQNLNNGEPSPDPHLLQQNKLLKGKVEKLTEQLAKLNEDNKTVLKNYNMRGQLLVKSEKQLKRLQQSQKKINELEKQASTFEIKQCKLIDDIRFYKNEISLLKKQLKNAQTQTSIISEQYHKIKEQLQQKIQKQQNIQVVNQPQPVSPKDLTISQLEDLNETLKQQLQKKQNALVAAHKKIQSLALQKSIKTNQLKTQKNIPIHDDLYQVIEKKDKVISDMQFKISNLENILKYRAGEKGNEMLAFQKVINSMTETINDKQQQILSLKIINKQLTSKLKQSH